MFRKYFMMLIGVGLMTACQTSVPGQKGTDVPDHAIWNQLLKKYVKENGNVDYKAFKQDRKALNTYLELLENNPPDNKRWSRDEQIAYWINVYNAFTVELVLKHYPLESIKDIGSFIQIPFINTPWDIKFIKIGNEELDLNNIEHSILRDEFEEPRIHFAVNCASISCPKLRREAYTGEKLNEQLNEQAVAFINDPDKNKLSTNEVIISRIFKWYKGDFINDRSLIEYLNQYSEINIKKIADIGYMDYDWGLNDTEDR